MTIKHKLLQDFQLMLSDKTIFVLKFGSIIEDYKFKSKNESIDIDPDIVNANPQYFQIVDWKAELISYMRQNKLPTPAILGKKLIPFIEEMFVITSETSSTDSEREYKSKLKILNERESSLEKEYRSKLREISDKESDYEIKIQKLEKRAMTLEEEYEQLSNKESDVRKKLKESREKEESLKDIEFEIGKRERNIDKLLLESEKNLDERQIDMNIKLESKLKEIDKREEELNRREKEIQSIDVNKFSTIKDRLVSYYDSVPWFHNNMGIYQSGLNSIIQDF